MHKHSKGECFSSKYMDKGLPHFYVYNYCKMIVNVSKDINALLTHCVTNVMDFRNENVRIVIFGSDTTIKKEDIVKHIGSIMDGHVGKALLSRVVDALGVPIDGKGALSVVEQRHMEVQALGIIARKVVHKPMQT